MNGILEKDINGNIYAVIRVKVDESKIDKEINMINDEIDMLMASKSELITKKEKIAILHSKEK